MTSPTTHPRAARPLTEMQQATLRFIRTHMSCHDGLSPTLDEIAESLRVRKVTVHGHVAELRVKGWLTTEKHRSRSIRLIRGNCPCCGATLKAPVAP